MSEPEYDAATCITAGELRAAGHSIPENIPDCGWVPRSALRVGKMTTRLDGDRIHMSVDVEVTEPFRWYECDVKFSNPKAAP